MEEIWKDIPGYEGMYQASTHGRIKSLDRKVYNPKSDKAIRKGKMLKPFKNNKGYFLVDLRKNSKRKTMQVHRIIGITFIPNPENNPEINHKDLNPLNNLAENLEWCTHQENMDHAMKNNARKRKYTGVLNPRAKLTEQDVLDIRKLRKFYTCKELSVMFDIGITAISDICNRKSWKHI